MGAPPHLSRLAHRLPHSGHLDLFDAICSVHGLPERHSRSVSEGGQSTDHPGRKYCCPETTLQLMNLPFLLQLPYLLLSEGFFKCKTWDSTRMGAVIKLFPW